MCPVTLFMGGAMTIIMLGFMLGMYRNRRLNVLIALGGVALVVLGTFLARSQITVQDRSYI